MAVCLLQKMLNIHRPPRRLELSAEGLVTELAGDVFQSPQMVTRPIRRRNEQEEELNGLAIETLEIDPVMAPAGSRSDAWCGERPRPGRCQCCRDPPAS